MMIIIIIIIIMITNHHYNYHHNYHHQSSSIIIIIIINHYHPLRYPSPPSPNVMQSQPGYTNIHAFRLTAPNNNMLYLNQLSPLHQNVSSPEFNPKRDGWKCLSFWLKSTQRLFKREFHVYITYSNGTMVSLWSYKSIVDDKAYIQLPLPSIDDDIKVCTDDDDDDDDNDSNRDDKRHSSGFLWHF